LSDPHLRRGAVQAGGQGGLRDDDSNGGDGGPRIEPPPDPSSSRGLDIIRALAADWTITTTPTGRAVSGRLNWQPS